MGQELMKITGVSTLSMIFLDKIFVEYVKKSET